MKTILYLTDFSSVAANALSYAVEVAKRMNARLGLLHVHDFPLIEPREDENIAVQSSLECKKLRKNVRDKLSRIVVENNLQEFPHRCFVRSGIPANAVKNLSNQIEVEMIVMGTRGETAEPGLFLGSTAIRVIREAICPVIVIPPDAKFQPIKKVAFATALNEQEYENIHQAKNFASLFDAEFSLVHVTSEKTVVKKSPFFKEEVQLIYADDIFVGLNVFAQREKPDIIAIKTHSGFWDHLLTKSITKHLILHGHLPLLVFNQ